MFFYVFLMIFYDFFYDFFNDFFMNFYDPLSAHLQGVTLPPELLRV